MSICVHLWFLFLDAWLVDEMAIAPEAIHDIALSVPGVVNCHDIASRGVLGRQVFIEMHLIVDAPDVETAHRITEEVEATRRTLQPSQDFNSRRTTYIPVQPNYLLAVSRRLDNL